MDNMSIPIATRWLLDAVGNVGRMAVESVFLIYCPKTQSKGTGFLLRSGYIVTNNHVVAGCSAGDVVALSCDGKQIRFDSLIQDTHLDLALLVPGTTISGGLAIRPDLHMPVGAQVCTWGYPLGYNGPAPLLTVGHLAGYSAEGTPPVKHLVVNAAFNPGNSGGPLFLLGEDSVTGVVVSKHAPISQWLLSIFSALQNQRSGVVYTATDEHGNQRALSEAQLVAEVLLYFRQMTQVVIGEAIAGEELNAFLKSNGATA